MVYPRFSRTNEIVGVKNGDCYFWASTPVFEISSKFQNPDLAFQTHFDSVLILKSMKNRFFSDFRFFVGLDFITIEISEVFYP